MSDEKLTERQRTMGRIIGKRGIGISDADLVLKYIASLRKFRDLWEEALGAEESLAASSTSAYGETYQEKMISLTSLRGYLRRAAELLWEEKEQ